MTIVWILLIILAGLAGWFVLTYNGLITLRNRTDEAWSDIDVQLKRRYDLIPNLVNTVKGYASHESGVFQKVTEARSKAMSAESPHDKAEAENMLSNTLKSLFAVVEAYPELKANANFAKLQDELSDTENKIQASRRFYNGNVRDFNIKIQTFPSNLIASIFKFITRGFFEIENAEERENVKVQF